MEVVPEAVRDVLLQGPSRGDVHHLHPAADAQQRHLAAQRFAAERDLEVVAVDVGVYGLGMGVGAVGGRVDVGAPGDHKSVEPVEQLAGILRDDYVGREQHGDSARALHGVVVGARDQRHHLVPGAVARLLDPGADPYKRSRHPGNLRDCKDWLMGKPGISWRDGRPRFARARSPPAPSTSPWSVPAWSAPRSHAI